MDVGRVPSQWRWLRVHAIQGLVVFLVLLLLLQVLLDFGPPILEPVLPSPLAATARDGKNGTHIDLVQRHPEVFSKASLHDGRGLLLLTEMSLEGLLGVFAQSWLGLGADGGGGARRGQLIVILVLGVRMGVGEVMSSTVAARKVGRLH